MTKLGRGDAKKPQHWLLTGSSGPGGQVMQPTPHRGGAPKKRGGAPKKRVNGSQRRHEDVAAAVLADEDDAERDQNGSLSSLQPPPFLQMQPLPPAPSFPSHAADSALAAGWQTVQDPSSGAFYYFNARTRQTSWTWPPESASAPPAQPPFQSLMAAPLPPSDQMQAPPSSLTPTFTQRFSALHAELANTILSELSSNPDLPRETHQALIAQLRASIAHSKQPANSYRAVGLRPLLEFQQNGADGDPSSPPPPPPLPLLLPPPPPPPLPPTRPGAAATGARGVRGGTRHSRRPRPM